ncbi:MAG: NAD(P)/FAD-dependent oxidoreductase [Parvibaculaceae bacterium]
MAEGPLEEVDVAVIGAGPAGLSAAIELRERGVSRVVVLERESEAGGVPRHCGHPPFGWFEYGRVLSGPTYAARLRADARDLDIQLRTTVAALGAGGRLDLATPEGPKALLARRVILATGARETPRSARLVGGARPVGVTTTGALQAMVYLKNRAPFERPLIVGTELVSFSAILTCRKAGIRPVAIVEETARVVAPWPCIFYPRLLGIPVHMSTRVVAIEGGARVEAALLRDGQGHESRVACDGVLFTGRFVPEASLLRASHLAVDPATGGPVVDQTGRCSDPAYFAAGNVLRPIETAGWSFREGRTMGATVAEDLARAPGVRGHAVSISPRPPVRLVMPQKLTLPTNGTGLSALQLRVERPVTGDLRIVSGGVPIWRRHVRTGPERRLLVPLNGFLERIRSDTLTVEFEERTA